MAARSELRDDLPFHSDRSAVRTVARTKTIALEHLPEPLVVAAIAGVIEVDGQHLPLLVHVELHDQPVTLEPVRDRKRRQKHLDRRGRVIGLSAAARPGSYGRPAPGANTSSNSAARPRTTTGCAVPA